MKLKFSTILGVACLATGFLGANTTASAIPITGTEVFLVSGVGSQSGGNTSITFSNSALVLPGGSGDYATTAFSSATFTNFSYNSSGLIGGPVVPLWIFTSLANPGKTFSFDLNSVNAASESINAGAISLNGMGTAHITGLEDTSATFALQGTGVGFTFTITSSTTATGDAVTTVPDGGSAVALLGLALVGIEGVRRKMTVKVNA